MLHGYRVDEDCAQHHRLPSTLTITWRHVSRQYGGRQSSSIRFPTGVGGQGGKGCDEGAEQRQLKRAALLAGAAEQVLRKNLKEPFHLTLLNLGVSGFLGIAPAAPLQHHFAANLGRPGADAARGVALAAAAAVQHGAGGGEKAFDEMTRERGDYDWKLRRVHGGAGGVVSKMQERALRESKTSLCSKVSPGGERMEGRREPTSESVVGVGPWAMGESAQARKARAGGDEGLLHGQEVDTVGGHKAEDSSPFCLLQKGQESFREEQESEEQEGGQPDGDGAEDASSFSGLFKIEYVDEWRSEWCGFEGDEGDDVAEGA